MAYFSNQEKTFSKPILDKLSRNGGTRNLVKAA
jgi:hypothetical protein